MNGLPALVLCMAVTCSATGPTEPIGLLESFDGLQRRLGEPDLRLLDARPKAQYDKGHIPGAVWVDARAVEKMAAKPGALSDRAAWETLLAPLGISPSTKVLVYDAHRQLDAARVWWLLAYLGVGQVGLIDGGFPLWEKQGRPVTVSPPSVTPRALHVRFRTERLAGRQEVLKAVKQGSPSAAGRVPNWIKPHSSTVARNAAGTMKQIPPTKSPSHRSRRQAA
jgi:thiosulfate/3-mercaptopyruvate sulfurtransferase